MKSFILVFSCLMGAFFVAGQKSYVIKKSTNTIKVDGFLNEQQWLDANIATDFITTSPIYGKKSKFKSIVKLYYDDNALYIAGEMHDPHPDSISYSMSQRDNFGNADWFNVTIDTYGNKTNGFSFAVTSAGVELDALAFTNYWDISWNAVWRSAVQKRDFGWSFEMKIPFSALRFPNQNVQTWNINFVRQVRRVRESSSWNPIDPEIFGELTQAGVMHGIEGVKSPVRLSFTPYVTGYLENSTDYESGERTWKSRITGGLDLKYGINDAFTLDMTVIPDFGQTRSDNQILNLGPFEVRYNENRPFFIEGTDLFQIGGVFYSRRIASSPYHEFDVYTDLNDSIGEHVVENPGIAQMINGTKVSGRTKNGLGIGIFNAVENKMDAIIEDSLGNRRLYQTNPLTNYNVFVLSQNLKNNSSVSFVNTNVVRIGNDRDANVSVGQARIFTKDGKYRLFTQVNVSSIMEDEMIYGHKVNFGFSKVAGKWRYGMNYGEESDTYDPNDLGFLYNNNSRSYSADVSWNDFKPSKYFFRRSIRLSWYYEELYKPQLYSYSGFFLNIGGLHKKQVYMALSVGGSPFGEVNHFESRHFGRVVRYKPRVNASYFFTTDYSKRFALDGDIGYVKFFGNSQEKYSFYLSPRLRISDRIMLVVDASLDLNNNDYGFVYGDDPNFSDEIIIGFRDRVDVENSISLEFVFTKRMGVDFSLRHYWAQVEYNGFAKLGYDGEMIDIDYQAYDTDGNSLHNTNFNAFTLDVNYRWIFIPGSELRIVYKNNIFASKSTLEQHYFETFETLFNQPQINSISMKLLVYIDVLYFKRKKKGQRVI